MRWVVRMGDESGYQKFNINNHTCMINFFFKQILHSVRSSIRTVGLFVFPDGGKNQFSPCSSFSLFKKIYVFNSVEPLTVIMTLLVLRVCATQPFL